MKIKNFKFQISNFSNMRKLAAVIICALAFSPSFAQFEPQFTQYMFNEMFINPAYAGSRGNISTTAFYRNQWAGLKGSPTSQTFSIHGPLYKDKIGLGLSLLNEEIGVTHQFMALASYAYRLKFESGGYLSMGLQGGIISHQEDLSEVVTNDPNDNEFLANTDRVVVPNTGFGLYYYTNRFYAGFSIPRMLENEVDIANGTDVTNRLNMDYWHYNLMSAYVFDVSESVRLKPSFLIKAVSGAPVVADFSLHALIKDVFWIGGSYRTGDAFTGTIVFQFSDKLRAGYSYDYTLTELQNASSGTHEISLGYDFSFNKKKVVTPRFF